MKPVFSPGCLVLYGATLLTIIEAGILDRDTPTERIAYKCQIDGMDYTSWYDEDELKPYQQELFG